MSVSKYHISLNANFLEKLDNSNELLFVNSQGLISKQNSLISKISSYIFKKIVPSEDVFRSAVQYLVKKRCDIGKYRTVKDEASFRVFITNILIKLESHGILTPLLKEQILEDCKLRILGFYKNRKIDKSNPETQLIARSNRALELANDQLLPISLKKEIGAFPLNEEETGISLTYFIKDEKGIIGVFKPKEGEIGMPFNPRKLNTKCDLGYENHVDGIPLGCMWKSEIAAYLFAKGKLGLIPVTTAFEADLLSTKTCEIKRFQGSLQAFVNKSKTIDQKALLTQGNPFSDVPSELIQGTTFRDLLIGNQDRHSYNFLFKGRSLIGIDHGGSFAEGLIRPKNRLQRTVTVLFDNPACLIAPVFSVKRDFLSIDIKKEIQSLKNQGLINDSQALELKMRHYLLDKLLKFSPELSVSQIGMAFFDLREKDGILKKSVDQAWESITDFEKSEKGSKLHNKLFSNFKRQVDMFLSDPIIIENLNI